MSKFKDQVLKIVKIIPYGTVASYGQVALMAGVPRAPRQVGEILRRYGNDIEDETFEFPWWRVVNNAGRISIKGAKNADANLQKELLEKEGIKVSIDFTFDIEKYRFHPDEKLIKSLKLPDEYIFNLIEKYKI